MADIKALLVGSSALVGLVLSHWWPWVWWPLIVFYIGWLGWRGYQFWLAYKKP